LVLVETPWTIEPGVKQDFIFKERFDFYNLLEKQSNNKKILREQLLNRALEVYKAVDFYKEKVIFIITTVFLTILPSFFLFIILLL
jgi:hypothetical protein